ncbi:hypothetical protein ACR79T_10075 [Sphingobacterium spiritivorum]|uniref:hypothetical protein n=1 Tax=Sphingobacterium spiritivorum TaxID=258 RepID=UPI003DA57668
MRAQHIEPVSYHLGFRFIDSSMRVFKVIHVILDEALPYSDQIITTIETVEGQISAPIGKLITGKQTHIGFVQINSKTETSGVIIRTVIEVDEWLNNGHLKPY